MLELMSPDNKKYYVKYVRHCDDDNDGVDGVKRSCRVRVAERVDDDRSYCRADGTAAGRHLLRGVAGVPA